MTDFGELLPPRSIEDILAERVRLTIGSETYDLPVLTIRENRAWRERMDGQLAYLLMRLSIEDDTDKTLALFDGSEHVWMDLLTSYDRSGVLPPVQAIEDGMTPFGLVKAVLEVWRAARPLADIAKMGMEHQTSAPSTVGLRERMSSWLRRTGGQPAGSRPN